jgi:hypothetical protein
VIWDSRQQLFAAYQGKDAFAAWREDVLWDYVNHGTYDLPDGRVALKCPAEVEAHVFATTMSLDIFSQLDRITCPTLILRGERTDPPLALTAERVAQRIPHGSLVTVPETSHFLAMEKPEEIARIINEYFQGYRKSFLRRYSRDSSLSLTPSLNNTPTRKSSTVTKRRQKRSNKYNRIFRGEPGEVIKDADKISLDRRFAFCWTNITNSNFL